MNRVIHFATIQSRARAMLILCMVLARTRPQTACLTFRSHNMPALRRGMILAITGTGVLEGFIARRLMLTAR
ncbi:hypothetical protein Micbo1qcDRAFT_157903 [Microdochium bolleyi]|uniref:Uncharacterized protein n=1 Tax=Microdochium bolleyi TaxID=196109 RepID=A0A136JFA3_9PEZI|nr:hypothetical protein Micbo1qcDRAFT_157903 [Microdochium bolleyi]